MSLVDVDEIWKTSRALSRIRLSWEQGAACDKKETPVTPNNLLHSHMPFWDMYIPLKPYTGLDVNAMAVVKT